MFVGTGYLSVYTLHVVFIFPMSGLGPCVLHDETNMELICLLSLVAALMVYSLLMMQQSNFPLLIDDITQESTIRVFAVITQQCPSSIGKYILLFLQFELTVIVSFHFVKPLSFYTKYKYIA